MKKILTVLTSVLLLCAMALSMASCGSVDMEELKAEFKLYDTDENKKSGWYVDIDEGESQTNSKAILKRYSIAHEDYGTLTVIEYANKSLAKNRYDYYKLYDKIQDEKPENKYEEESYDIDLEYNKLLSEIGEATGKVDAPDEKVTKRKGAVIIRGDKELYDKFF